MFQIERIQKILEYVNERGSANVAELQEKFGVSSVTIRRDIDQLEQKGLAVKTHGGIVSAQAGLSNEIPFRKKHETNPREKERIGMAAAGLVRPNDTVILDAGTTTLQVARHITAENVTAITNDLFIAMELANKGNVELIVLGGKLEKDVYTLTGPGAMESLRRFHANIAFLGCDALDAEFGVSNRSLSEVEVKTAMKDAADKAVMVSDDSKFHKKLFYSLFPIGEIDELVTNRVDDRIRETLAEHGVALTVVPE